MRQLPNLLPHKYHLDHELTYNPSSSNSSSKRHGELDIVHLGGTHVGGLTYEHLQLLAPNQSQPCERPITQWDFYEPLPNQPGIGIAIANPADEPKGNLNTSDKDEKDRPLTQWFTAPPPVGENNGVKDKASKESLYQQPVSYATLTADPIEEKMLSPWTPTSSSNLTNSQTSHASSISPLLSPVSSITDLAETNPPPPKAAAPFPKRSTSLSQASRHAPPPLSQRAIVPVEGVPLRAKQVHLRRTQSHAEGQRPVYGRRHSPRHVQPILHEERETERETESGTAQVLMLATSLDESPNRGARKEDVGNSPLRLEPRPLPPLTYPPPAGPLPPISGTKLAGHGKMRNQIQVQGQRQSQGPRHKRDASYTSNERTSREDQVRDRDGDREQEHEREYEIVEPEHEHKPERERERERNRDRHREDENEREIERSSQQTSSLSLSPNPNSNLEQNPNPESEEAEQSSPIQVRVQSQAQNHNQNQNQNTTQSQPQQPRQRLTSKERFWLHRQYRGEANFLKAWGLDISSAGDREDGLIILRELMEGEAREETEDAEREQRQHHHHHQTQTGSISRSSSTASSTRDRDRDRDRDYIGVGLGLDVIAEESQGRVLSSSDSSIIHGTGRSTSEEHEGEGEGQEVYWKVQQRQQQQYESREREQQQRLRSQTQTQTQQGPIVSLSVKNRPPSDKRSRAESENSVLGAYLDLRLSHPI